MLVPNPDGTRQPCGQCGQPTAIAETVPGQPVRVHCGTCTNACQPSPRRGGTR
jgi:ribosomal protein S27AE